MVALVVGEGFVGVEIAFDKIQFFSGVYILGLMLCGGSVRCGVVVGAGCVASVQL